MRPGSIALAAGSAIVAIGGLYLMLELRGTAPPAAPDPIAARRPTAARPSPALEREPTTAGKRPDRPGFAAPRPMPVPKSDVEPAPMLAQLDGDIARTKPELSADTSDRLLEANKLYDRGDYDGARQLAVKLLDDAPGNVRLLRVVVSSSCILGDGDTANQYAPRLPEPDRLQMIDRCAKFQIALASK